MGVLNMIGGKKDLTWILEDSAYSESFSALPKSITLLWNVQLVLRTPIASSLLFKITVQFTEFVFLDSGTLAHY